MLGKILGERGYNVSTELDTLSGEVLGDRGMMKRREPEF